MGIYERDNIPYQNIIDSMIRNRQAGAKIKSDNWRKQGEIWSNFTKEMGQMGGRMLDAYQANQEDPNVRLKALEEELRQAEIEEKYNEQVKQRQAMDEYLNRQATVNDLINKYTIESRDREAMDNYNKAMLSKDMEGYVPFDYDAKYNRQMSNVPNYYEAIKRRGGVY